jgi:hypothetical protein
MSKLSTNYFFILLLFVLVYSTNQKNLFSRPEQQNTPASKVYEKIYSTIDDKEQIILLSNTKSIFNFNLKKITLVPLELQNIKLQTKSSQDLCFQF